MKKFLPVFLLFFLLYNTSQSQCAGDRYRNFIFPSSDVTADVIYGSNINQTGDLQDLDMDIYQPSGDNETNRALLIICHGGYFLAGDKAGIDVVPMCQDFSKMGFVVASINYRLGIPIETNLELPYGQALLRSVQDLRAAIRFFRKNAAENGNEYGIDPDQIYVGGDSAGGFMALHLAYFDEDEIPAWLDTSIAGLEGGIEGESGNPGYSSEINAIFSVSGAIGQSEWIDAEDTTPACLFHGDNDATVTINSEMFVLFGLLQVTEIDGSNPISEKLDEFNIEYCYEINEGLGHVPYQGNPAVYDTTISIISNFLTHYICDIPLDCSYRELSTSIDEVANNEVSISPNPTSGIIRLNTANQKFDRFTIYDMNGRKIMTERLNGENVLNVSHLEGGIYFVKLDGGTARNMVKLVIE